MKKLLFLVITILFICGCVTATKLPPQEVIIKIEATEPTTIEVEKDRINKTMQIQNQEGTLSNLSFISGDKAYIKIFSALTVGDVTSLWGDLCILENNPKVRTINLFISSPGGDAFSGLALADEIERAKRRGFHVIAHASGVVASAALPVLVVCNERLAAPGTIFMVHETSLWKWPGRETRSDIRAQNELLGLLRDRYLEKLAQHTKANKKEWERMEDRTTWFDAKQALEWGVIDRIE